MSNYKIYSINDKKSFLKIHLIISFLIFIISIASVKTSAQKIIDATGSYTIELSRTKTMEETELLCIEQAKLFAIAAEFGTVVSETTISNIKDENGKVDDQFTVLSRTTVKGEWVVDTAAPEIQWVCQNSLLSVTVTVNGKIRGLSKSGKSNVNFYTCTNASPDVEKYTFKEGENLYASFQSSKDGYLSLFYVDYSSMTIQRLLPANSGDNLDALQINADQKYILFDRKLAYKYGWVSQSSELELTLPVGKTSATDELVAVFTEEPYSKPLLQSSKAGLSELQFSDFENWLSDLKIAQASATINRISLTLTQ